MTSADERIRPLLVVGISGATWSVIGPMIAEGELPHLAALVRDGARGTLASVRTSGDRHFRPQTAWPSVFSGKVPERHGVTEWFHTARDLTARCLWDFFDARGLASGLYGTPLTWPPPRIRGFVVPSLYARDAQAWPEELSYLAGYYRGHQDAKLRPGTWAILARSARLVPMIAGRGQDPRVALRLLGAAARLATVRGRERRTLVLRHAKLDFGLATFLRLLGRFRPRLAVFNVFEVDTLSHRFWRYHEPERFGLESSAIPGELRNAVRGAYAHVDQCLGTLLARFPPDAVVAVVSEHGMGAEVPSGEIGRWRYMIDAARVRELAGLGPEIVGVPIARWVAYRRADGGPLDPAVASALERFTVLENGRPLFRVRRNGTEEAILKLALDREHHADLEDVGTLHVRVGDREVVPITRLVARAGPTRSAMHRGDAVLVVKGPGIRAGEEVRGGSIVDVLPTLLHACGLAVPDDLDGRPLDVFAHRTELPRECATSGS